MVSDSMQGIHLYKRFKSSFITFHSAIYDHAFNCNSHIISFTDDLNIKVKQYGRIIIFFSYLNQSYVFLQKYFVEDKQISDLVELPVELCTQINLFFPIVSLSDVFTIIPVNKIQHKCILVLLLDAFCVSEIKVDYEHD